MNHLSNEAKVDLSLSLVFFILFAVNRGILRILHLEIKSIIGRALIERFRIGYNNLIKIIMSDQKTMEDIRTALFKGDGNKLSKKEYKYAV